MKTHLIRWALICIIGVVAVIASELSCIGVMRVSKYKQLMRKESAAQVLSIVPTDKGLINDHECDVHDIGYAEAHFENITASTISSNGSINVNTAAVKITLMRPLLTHPKMPLSDQAQNAELPEVNEYGWNIECIQLEKLGYGAVIVMNSRDFEKYIGLAVGKLLLNVNCDRVAVYRADRTKGIVRYQNDGGVACDIWSSDEWGGHPILPYSVSTHDDANPASRTVCSG